MSPIVVRPARKGDEERLFAHLQRHFAESENGDLIFQPGIDFRQWKKDEYVARWSANWEKPLSIQGWERFWIAESGERIVGHVDMMSQRLASSLHRAVFAIGLENEARGQGLGRRLSLGALEWARSQPQLEWIDLYVFSHNGPARALYRALGFTEVATVRDLFRVRGQSIDDIHMTLRLH